MRKRISCRHLGLLADNANPEEQRLIAMERLEEALSDVQGPELGSGTQSGVGQRYRHFNAPLDYFYDLLPLSFAKT